jgi:quinol monooxygenase YgiN
MRTYQHTAMNPIVHVVAHIEAIDGFESDVRAVLESYLAPTRLEKGCIRYDLFTDDSDPKKFTFIEEWASKEDLEAHSKSAHLAAGRIALEGKKQPHWVQLLTQVQL